MMFKKKKLLVTGLFIMLSVVFTALTKVVDVRAIGPQNSEVGFASLNEAVHEFFGVNMVWYHITDWLGLLPIVSGMIFAGVGFVQLVKRKSLFKVDKSLIALGVFYLITLVIYILFEKYVINYRPILMDGYLEASYPSSHTLMVVCFMGAAMMVSRKLLKSRAVRTGIDIISILTIAITVIGRLISGVHWFTDIVGGLVISMALLMTYSCNLNANRKM